MPQCATVGERIVRQTQDSEHDNDLSCVTKSCPSEDATAREEEATETERFDSDFPVNPLSEWGESELEERRQFIEDGVVIFSPESTAEELLIDEVICGVLSRYPLSPPNDLRSFQRIVQALLFSAYPLPSLTLASLLGLEDSRHVKRLILPASPLILIPKSEDNEEDEDWVPIRFIDSSIVNFFLDQMRSGRFYVDGPRAHRMLLGGCTLVMKKMYEGRLDTVRDWWWIDAFKYAHQNWEGHRCASTRSKL